MKLTALNKIAKAINKIFDWGIEALIAFASRLYNEMRTRKGRAYVGRVLILLVLAYAVIEITTKPSEYVRPVKAIYDYNEIRVLELEQETQEVENRLQEYLEFETSLNNGERWAIVEYINKKFGKEAPLALAIADCESHLRPEAVGDGNLTFSYNGKEYGKSYGVFQIRHLRGRPEPEYLLNAKNNIDYAHEIYSKQGGFQAWSCYSMGYYEKHLSLVGGQ